MLLGLFVLTSLSCERDEFLVDDYVDNGEPVNIVLGFELPQKNEAVVTRTLTDIDEHHIGDFYILIFDSEGNRVFGKYYPDSEMNKVEYRGGDWSSVEAHKEKMDDANSTHGYVIAKAVAGTCYIFGFANIGDSTEEVFEPVNTLEATAVKKNLWEGLTSNRWKLDHVRNLNDLYEVQVDAMSDAKDNILVREQPNLMYSGAWQEFGENGQRDEYNHTRSAGQVTIKNEWVDNNGNVDLRSHGMIYLRTLTSHFKFNIEINEEVFSAFEPESWQVINLPKRVYLMDQRLETNPPVKRAEIDFKASTVMKNQMVHEDALYTFDFWMFENHKKARKISSDELGNSLRYATKDGGYVSDANKSAYSDAYFADAAEVADVKTHYQDRFGDELTQWETSKGSGEPLKWLKTVYGYGSWNEAGRHHTVYGYPADYTAEQVNQAAINQFVYAKRELQVKRYTINNNPVWNRTGDYYPYTPASGHTGYPTEKNEYTVMQYDSKKFLYAEDKATYVVIKGRLRFNNANPVQLTNWAYNYKTVTEGDYLTTKTDTFSDGYVDVTYTIHLGNLNEGFDNFDCLRNTEYIYNVKINNVNSIYTTIQTSDADPFQSHIRVKRQHGADGLMNMAKGVVYNTDAHFCQFNMMLTKEALNSFFFEMNTPWNSFSTEDFYVRVNTVDDANQPVTEKRFIYLDHITKHKTLGGGYVNDYTTQDQNRVRQIVTNQDFTWFKFTPNVDQRGMFDTNDVFSNNETSYKKVRQTEKYNRALSGITLWNLYEFTLTMESLVAAEKAATPTATSEASVASAKARIDNLLAQRFECTVGDDSYTGSTALPFMLDEVSFVVDSAVKNLIAANRAADSGLAACQTITDNGNGTWTVTENYAEYLKATESAFSDKTLAPIRRMFYTVYLDEYYYYEQPYGVSSWVKPYWKHFANQPSRYVNFGYRAADYTGEGENEAGFKMSSDGQSGIMLTQLTIVQPSIQTFYSTERMNTSEKYEVAIGLEHVNETHDPRWYAGAGSDPRPGSFLEVPESDSEMSTYNGWTLAKKYLCGAGYDGSWDYFVGREVWDLENGFQNNVIMATSTRGKTTVPTNRSTSGNVRSDDSDNPYLAEAVRMCMNRNRDENGNGKIDESELKWFLPTSRQYELAALGHYSLQDPLFNYNQFVNYTPASFNPDIERHGAQILAISNNSLQGQNAWKYHYVASDFQTLTSEEMANSPTYGIKADYQSKPYEMRCMRNLGGEYDKYGSIIEDGLYDLPAPYNYVSKTPQSLLFNYDEVNKIFEMTYYDNRSVRGIYYVSEELPKHFLFSANNLPYYRFQVARDIHYIEKIPSGTTYEDVITSRPCSSYSQLDDGSDQGSWRMPNHAELSLMVIQLRQKNESMGIYKVEEMSPAWFFHSTKKVLIFSATSWNYTGYYARMQSVNYNDDEGWGIHTTNPKKQGGYPNDADNFIPTLGELGSTFYVRCVKDVRGDMNNYKEFWSDSENYGQSYGGSDSEGFTEDD